MGRCREKGVEERVVRKRVLRKESGKKKVSGMKMRRTYWEKGIRERKREKEAGEGDMMRKFW